MIFKKSNIEYIIVGLGNPGKKYELTRHNVGFRALDELASSCGIRISRARFNALTGEGRVAGVSVLLMKPTTFMNLSGQAVAAAAKYYGVEPARIIAVCDDVTLEPGVIRIRRDGSCGGHNGLRSIIDLLDTESFPRVKIGVGKKPRPDSDLADHVLAMPSSADRKLIETRTPDIIEALKLMVNGSLELAQSRYNG